MARDEGLAVEPLAFKKVLHHLEATTGIRITQASLIRRVSLNQEAFHLDVECSIINDQSALEVGEVSDSLAETFLRIDVSSIEIRSASLAELIRVSTKDYLSTTTSPLSTIQTALAACALAGERGWTRSSSACSRRPLSA